MAHVGRLLKAQMRDVDTPERIAERVRYNQISAQVGREREERYPVITVENVDEVLRWQEQRIRELVGEVA